MGPFLELVEPTYQTLRPKSSSPKTVHLQAESLIAAATDPDELAQMYEGSVSGLF